MDGGEEDKRVKGTFTAEEVILGEIDELKDSIQKVLDNIQKLIYYVIVIGALNGTISVGKMVEKLTGEPVQQETGAVANHVRS